jgi:hypothetical protein
VPRACPNWDGKRVRTGCDSRRATDSRSEDAASSRPIEDSKASWPRQLLADARQGVVGSAAWVVLVLAVGLAGLLGWSVPAWLFAAVVVIVVALASTALVGMRRRIDRLEGALEEARLRGEHDARRAMEAGDRLAEASHGDMPAPMSPRAQGYVRQIKALRQSVDAGDERIVPQPNELALLSTLIGEMRRGIGDENASLQVILQRWVTFVGMNDDSRGDLVATLDQLERRSRSLRDRGHSTHLVARAGARRLGRQRWMLTTNCSLTCAGPSSFS